MKPYALIVDDNPDQREILFFSFEKAGFEVFTAENGTQAIEYLEKVVPKALILDVNMPGISGLSILRKVRQSASGHKITILLVSADEQALNSPEASLADAVLLKPLSPSSLVTIANRMIESVARTEANGVQLRSQLQAQLQKRG